MILNRRIRSASPLSKGYRKPKDISRRGLNLPDLIIELWKQVDDLNNEVRSHKQKIGRLEDKTGVSSGVGSTGRMSKD